MKILAVLIWLTFIIVYLVSRAEYLCEKRVLDAIQKDIDSK